MPSPNFENLLRVLRREAPSRPTLFEFFLNDPLYLQLSGMQEKPTDKLEAGRMYIQAYANAGYDYTTTHGANFGFPSKAVAHQASRSMNDTAVIADRADFDAYPWPDPNESDYSPLEILAPDLPAGMKFVAYGPGGVLENVMQLVGYETLCLLTMDDPQLVEDIFTAVGSRFVRYYEICAQFDSVGALISNDDWGFNTQTMLAPDDMRRYVFPWHRRIVETIHAAGKPAILHSCGNLASVMDDIIDDMRYDGKHSYEDKICPVEEAYERWGSRIAILGGLDLDFVCRATPEAIRARAAAMLERSATRGGYALGTGNSVPEYVPTENYFAMIGAATSQRA
ncbi:MAG TPA: uroporphyrinogen decarboxylase family protein [Armatimonadota bacterium]|jgi:uroporphyrinogen decarboxylase